MRKRVTRRGCKGADRVGLGQRADRLIEGVTRVFRSHQLVR